MSVPSRNTNSTLSSTGTLMDVNYRCIPDLGSGLSAIGCGQALWALNEHDSILKTWGPRASGDALTTLSADGNCVIEVVVDPSRVSAEASEKEVTIGARAVVQNCIYRKIPSFGGIAKGLGDGGVAVLVRRGGQLAQCHGRTRLPSSFVDSCRTILDTMEVDRTPREFGKDHVDVELPYVVDSGEWETKPVDRYISSLTATSHNTDDQKCFLAITTSGPNVRASWYDIWSAAQIVAGMCSARGKPGTFELGGRSSCLAAAAYRQDY
ncbi:MAG: hypothetical protein Q9191_000243 [Dirinaria sp. TL-2023a]